MGQDIRDKAEQHAREVRQMFEFSAELAQDSRIPGNVALHILLISIERSKRMSDAFLAENCPKPNLRPVLTSVQAICEGEQVTPKVKRFVPPQLKPTIEKF